jgi:hypothetical protein
MSLKSEVRQTLKKIKNSPERFKNFLHQKWPQQFGHQVRSELVQLYKNDSDFTTALSFNHFIEFFSSKPQINLQVSVKAWTRDGKALGTKTVQINSKGAFQVLLKDLFPNLDAYGLFAVGMKLTPKYSPELEYLGVLSPQFMTIFIPTQSPSAPQMIHSHKIKQGFLLMPRQHVRKSSDIEPLTGLKDLELYVLNSSASALQAEVHVNSMQTGTELQKRTVNIPGYGVQKVSLDPNQLQASEIGFAYAFNRSVDHKKPILFRRFENGSVSCNHT